MSDTGPSVTTSTMITIQGDVASSAKSRPAVMSERELSGTLGPLLLVVKDEAAWTATKKFLEDMLSLGNQVWPEHDVFDELQAVADRRMATYGTEHPTPQQRRQVTADRQRRRLNGVGL